MAFVAMTDCRCRTEPCPKFVIECAELEIKMTQKAAINGGPLAASKTALYAKANLSHRENQQSTCSSL